MIQCPRCFQMNPPTAQMCSRCGVPVAQTASAPSPWGGQDQHSPAWLRAPGQPQPGNLPQPGSPPYPPAGPAAPPNITPYDAPYGGPDPWSTPVVNGPSAWGAATPAPSTPGQPHGFGAPNPGPAMPAQPWGAAAPTMGQPAAFGQQSTQSSWLNHGAQPSTGLSWNGLQQPAGWPATNGQQPDGASFGGSTSQGAQQGGMSASALLDAAAVPGWLGGPATTGGAPEPSSALTPPGGMPAHALVDDHALPSWLRAQANPGGVPTTGLLAPQAAPPTPQLPAPSLFGPMQGSAQTPVRMDNPMSGALGGGWGASGLRSFSDNAALPEWLKGQGSRPGAAPATPSFAAVAPQPGMFGGGSALGQPAVGRPQSQFEPTAQDNPPGAVRAANLLNQSALPPHLAAAMTASGAGYGQPAAPTPAFPAWDDLAAQATQQMSFNPVAGPQSAFAGAAATPQASFAPPLHLQARQDAPSRAGDNSNDNGWGNGAHAVQASEGSRPLNERELPPWLRAREAQAPARQPGQYAPRDAEPMQFAHDRGMPPGNEWGYAQDDPWAGPGYQDNGGPSGWQDGGMPERYANGDPYDPRDGRQDQWAGYDAPHMQQGRQSNGNMYDDPRMYGHDSRQEGRPPSHDWGTPQPRGLKRFFRRR